MINERFHRRTTVFAMKNRSNASNFKQGFPMSRLMVIKVKTHFEENNEVKTNRREVLGVFAD